MEETIRRARKQKRVFIPNETKMILTLTICAALLVPISANVEETILSAAPNGITLNRKSLSGTLDWIDDGVLGIIESFLPNDGIKSVAVEGIIRKKLIETEMP